MGSAFNKYYNYDDMKLWQDDIWQGHGAPLAPLSSALVNLSRKQQEADGTFTLDRFAERNDEIMPAPARAPFFRDVVDELKAQGIQFVSVGMVALAAVPNTVIRRENHAPKILLVPWATNGNGPHTAMNVIEANREMILRAAKEEVFVLFVTRPDKTGGMLQECGLETEGLFRITFNPVYIDLRAMKAAGMCLSDFTDAPWAAGSEETEVAGCPAIDVSDKWQGSIGHQYTINKMYYPRNAAPAPAKGGKDYSDPNGIRPAGGVPGYNDDKHLHSTAGRIQAESMHLELDYKTARDEALQAKLEQRGLKYEEHPFETGYWISLTPKCVFDEPEKKIPLLIIMKEPRLSIPFMTLTALQFYYPFLEIAANGEYMIMYFALEHPDDNDMLVDLIAECAEQYPVDLSRVYITGQSHNGYYALEFYHRHPELIACAATLADPIPLQVGATVTDYNPMQVEGFAQHDMPLININGQLENKMYTCEKGSALHREQAELYVNRLKAFRAKHIPTVEEVMAARDSSDYATRTIGVPSDRTEVQYCMGTELYIADVQNTDDRWHLRFVNIENTPHMIMPQMGEIAWSFMRRFARNTETGETIELY